MKLAPLLPLVTLALCAGCGSGAGSNAACAEGLTLADCEQLKTIVLPATLPPARGNAHADEFNSAVLGFHVFFDSRFSKNQKVRCESCHSVDYGFADNEPVSTAGLETGVRNSPTIFNSARYESFFWDGRADTLWSQPAFAFENPTEMGFTRLEIVHLLNAVYTREYADAFGPLPDFSPLDRFPAQGAPGNPAYDAMAEQDKTAVNSVVANVGKALEAYMRKLATGPSVIDNYLSGTLGSDPGASVVGAAATISAQQERGMVVFVKSGCLNCHSGPQLSDNQFHNLGVSAAADQAPDLGRSEAALETLKNNPFNASGPFFDGSPGVLTTAPQVLGGFRTPSLRNLPRSAPFGHNGSFATVGDIVDFHLQGGGKDPATYVGTIDPLLEPQQLPSDDRAALIEFLNALAGSYPALPWGQWPSGNG